MIPLEVKKDNYRQSGFQNNCNLINPATYHTGLCALSRPEISKPCHSMSAIVYLINF